MNAQELERMILKGDEQAPVLARQLGANAGPVLEKLSSNPDPEVRERNVMALEESTIAARDPLLIEALSDGDINVRSAAVRALHKTASAALLPDLQSQAATNADPYVRGELALIIGRVAKKGDTAILQGRRVAETDGDANHKVTLALARLGDDKARQAMRLALASPDPQARLKAVWEYEYINDPKTLVDLKPALADPTDVFNINPPHARPRLIRLCDVAVNVVNTVASPKLPFNAGERRRFEPAEIAQVVRLVESLK